MNSITKLAIAVAGFVGVFCLGHTLGDMVTQSAVRSSPSVGLFDMMKQAPAPYTITKNGDTTNIYFSTEFSDPEGYATVLDLLIQAREGQKINIYMSGYGGQVKTTDDIAAAIVMSKGDITGIVYGDVYSGHAFLSLNMPKIKIVNPHTLFLFHVPGVADEKGNVFTVEELCHTIKTTDRGISGEEKCLNLNKKEAEAAKHTALGNALKVLNPAQLALYYAGHDVVITGEQVLKNMSNASIGS